MLFFYSFLKKALAYFRGKVPCLFAQVVGGIHKGKILPPKCLFCRFWLSYTALHYRAAAILQRQHLQAMQKFSYFL